MQWPFRRFYEELMPIALTTWGPIIFIQGERVEFSKYRPAERYPFTYQTPLK